MLNFLNKFGIFCFLDNHQYDFDKSYECLAGAGMHDSIASGNSHGLTSIDDFKRKHDDWIFGHIAYDAKNDVETLTSANPDSVQFPDFFFFVPDIVFVIAGKELKIGVVDSSLNTKEIFETIISSAAIAESGPAGRVELKTRFTEREYVETVEQLKRHLLKGDCYEINFCQEFYLDNTTLHPLFVYQRLSQFSPNPFSALYKLNDKYLVCASPERFLKKSGNLIISQPMKGTSRRITNDETADQALKERLFSDGKERAENIMIVDLVRNDLAKICKEGSVWVKDFLGIYSFPNVHQMISTVAGNLRDDISISEILRATFPMGSMTGAPKKRVMELIEKYERTRRGLFSGTIGYISPGGDFDFNVVIRSILYNQTKKYVSVQVGAAITFKSNAQAEYEECLIKMEAMKRALS